MHIYLVYMQMYVYTCVCVCAGQGSTSGVVSQVYLPCVFKQGLSVGPGTHQLDRLAS